jgi:DNA-binding CsgD family transcriptional regulator
VTKERFLPLAVVQRELALSTQEVLALVNSGALPAVNLLGSWRVERSMLEQFVVRLYVDTAVAIATERQRSPDDVGAAVEPTRPARSRSRARRKRQASPPEAAAELTPQMRRVLELVARGLSNSEIARELTLEVSTVKTHVSRLLSRLGLRNRENLIAFAWRSGLIRHED